MFDDIKMPICDADMQALNTWIAEWVNEADNAVAVKKDARTRPSLGQVIRSREFHHVAVRHRLIKAVAKAWYQRNQTDVSTDASGKKATTRFRVLGLIVRVKAEAGCYVWDQISTPTLGIAFGCDHSTIILAMALKRRRQVTKQRAGVPVAALAV